MVTTYPKLTTEIPTDYVLQLIELYTRKQNLCLEFSDSVQDLIQDIVVKVIETQVLLKYDPEIVSIENYIDAFVGNYVKHLPH